MKVPSYKKYWNSSNLSPKDPVVSNFCTQIDIKEAVDKADRKIARKNKEEERKKADAGAAAKRKSEAGGGNNP